MFYDALALLLLTGMGAKPVVLLGLPLVGLLGAVSARCLVQNLRWREILAALPLTPFLCCLLLAVVKLVFHLDSDTLVTIGEMSVLFCVWTNLGAFLLPLPDNDLRRKEPWVALPRHGISAVALFFVGLVCLALTLKHTGSVWQWGRYSAMEYGGLAALAVIMLGWLLGIAKAERLGAYLTSVGTTVLFAMAAYWVLTGGGSPSEQIF